jgi:hypothetical protein
MYFSSGKIFGFNNGSYEISCYDQIRIFYEGGF